MNNLVQGPTRMMTSEQSVPNQPGLWKLPPLRPPSRVPEVVAAEATEEVRRLEAAVSALGEGNAHSKPLLKALEVARARSQIAPVDKRIESCKSFLERARKRAGRLEEVIARATTEKEVCLQEIAESERRLQQLEAQVRVLPTQVNAQAEVPVGVLQEKIDALQKERDVLLAAATPVLPRPSPAWMGDGPPSLDNILPLPSANVQDVEYWLNCRNCEMRNALEHGDVGTVARCGSLVAQGAAMLANLSHDVPMNARSTLMTALINEGDSKRRCVEGGLQGGQ